MIEETMMHVQERPTPSLPALAPTRYGSGPVPQVAATITLATTPPPLREGLQGEFELEVEE